MSGIRGDAKEITCVRQGVALPPVLSATPLGLPLALGDPGGPTPSPGPGKLQPTPGLSVPLS